MRLMPAAAAAASPRDTMGGRMISLPVAKLPMPAAPPSRKGRQAHRSILPENVNLKNPLGPPSSPLGSVATLLNEAEPGQGRAPRTANEARLAILRQLAKRPARAPRHMT